ncbi:succinyl-diaminopimelate desuccinylase [Wenzhouxiangella marina]|uniref:Succinyl-diaminopimelate desuccinylase n=1 Tax=Wenzhouxiangella marina TaxID=1579979 RepID=A0A0K0XYT4_9GAMM|nr:succinyl-diaminopimelate desuccinylase [Wenzhouxiangella marina]AKS42786.1 Succinyl-diaminopimelate desuccinylase [Wenzhouxiangella marina]MBB6087536.1 succinyl-diaminopimelate desuccinylase [Wenzhouxiangella marina]
MTSRASAVLELTRELIRRASVTPEDAGCLDLIEHRLRAVGMRVERRRVGEVDNLFARHGESGPHLMLLGHTDVVPPGPLEEWTSPPFEPTERNGCLFGRGAADMKSSVAAFVVALEHYLHEQPDHSGIVSLLLTSDEEGPAEHGVRVMVPWLQDQGLLPDACLIGEPSSLETLGDNVRIGRRGSIQAILSVRGRQGHTAYADPADNPAHRAGPLLAALGQLDFEDGDAHFPPTRLQISNVQAGTGAENVTPGELKVLFNLRNNPNSPADVLEARLRALIEANDPGPWTLDWRVSGVPFGPATGRLPAVVDAVCRSQLGRAPVQDTGGGTSDGRFLGPLGIPCVELGPVNRTIHRIDECIGLDELERLPGLYHGIIAGYLSGSEEG